MSRGRCYQWTSERIRTLIHLREVEKLSWTRIGMALNLSTERARLKYSEIATGEIEPRKREARPADAALARAAQCFAEPPPTIAQALLGDPAPGRSALDRKRQEANA